MRRGLQPDIPYGPPLDGPYGIDEQARYATCLNPNIHIDPSAHRKTAPQDRARPYRTLKTGPAAAVAITFAG